MLKQTGDRTSLINGEMFWAISVTKGTPIASIGPCDMAGFTKNDYKLVRPDSENPGELVVVNDMSEAVQSIHSLGLDEYAVILHPVNTANRDCPNGQLTAGREVPVPELNYNHTRVIGPGVRFPHWPGQIIEIEPVCHLLADQYLIVEVISVADIDVEAPYYDLVLRCAAIKGAVVDETVAGVGRDSGSMTTKDLSKDQSSESDESDVTVTTEPALAEVEAEAQPPAKPPFRPRQRITIPGSMTSEFYPPSGFAVVAQASASVVVPREVVLASTQAFSFDEAFAFIRDRLSDGVLKIEDLSEYLTMAGLDELYHDVRQDYVNLREQRGSRDPLSEAIKNRLDQRDIKALARAMQSADQQDEVLPEEGLATSQDLIRQAPVPGPTEFCVLVDDEGRPNSKAGPGRVFPGPYDTFRTQGSRDGIYDAYHLRPDRGIVLRIVAETIDQDELLSVLPSLPGSCDTANLEKDEYKKGDQIFIGGFDAYVVPACSVFEVIDPETQNPHIGNNHSGVYVQSIGVDQKSGIYVADVETGNIKLLKGEKKALLDPGKEQHVNRRVPGWLWNLMIGHGEPHKKVDSDSEVVTPWAICISVPNNEAVLITSKDGRRPVIGPEMCLLEFEEILEVMGLSRGRCKTDDNPLKTCFLRVDGNRVTDQITLEAQDSTPESQGVMVTVSYHVRFEGDSDVDRVKWFNHKDYVLVLCEHFRSVLRSQARAKPFIWLCENMAEFIRDGVLGVKPESSTEEIAVMHRPGWKCPDNNMLVYEVEILDVRIQDRELAQSIAETGRKVIARRIEDTALEVELTSDRRRDEIAAEKAQFALNALQREHEKRVAAIHSEHVEAEKKAGSAHELAQEEADYRHKLAQEAEQHQEEMRKLARIRETTDAETVRLITEADRAKELEHRQKLAELEQTVLTAMVEADVKRLGALVPQLTAAMEAVGDKEVMVKFAEAMEQAGVRWDVLAQGGGLDAMKALLGQDSRLSTMFGRMMSERQRHEDGDHR